MKQQTTISGRECLLYTDGQPQVLLIQTLGGHEHNSIDTEVELIRKTVPVPFVMAAFAIRDWEAELTPWHDPEVSKRTIVGELAGETLLYLTDELIPYLRKQYGTLPHHHYGLPIGRSIPPRILSAHSTCTSVSATAKSSHATGRSRRWATMSVRNMHIWRSNSVPTDAHSNGTPAIISPMEPSAQPKASRGVFRS